MYDVSFKYPKEGGEVKPDFFSPLWQECANGIHFFHTFKEAKNYSDY
jgi:hypothetical protein